MGLDFEVRFLACNFFPLLDAIAGFSVAIWLIVQ